MTAAIAIFVKTPEYSPVKTRLARTLGAEAATSFHCLAARAVGEVACAAGAGLQAYWAVAERAALHDARWLALPRIGQGEGSLGERMHRVYSTLRRMYPRVLLTGADVPQQTPELLRRAAAALADPATPFVLGEAGDGGFWLFGGRVSVPRELWCGIAYSRHDTALRFREALRAHGRIAALPTLTDADRPSDLPPLTEALAALPAPLPAQRTLLQWLRYHPVVPEERDSFRQNAVR